MDAATEVRKYMAEDTNSSSTNDEEDCVGRGVPPGYPFTIPHSSSPNGGATTSRQQVSYSDSEVYTTGLAGLDIFGSGGGSTSSSSFSPPPLWASISPVVAPLSGSLEGFLIRTSEEESTRESSGERLLTLRHASRCPGKGMGEDPHQRYCLVPRCEEMRRLWIHMLQCPNGNCSYPLCTMATWEIQHFLGCESRDCGICRPVRQDLEEGSPDFDAMTAVSAMKGMYNGSTTTNDVVDVRDGAINIASQEDVLESRLLGMSILEARLAEGAEGTQTTAASMGCSVSCFPRRRRSGMKASLLPMVTAIRSCKLQQQHQREQQFDEEMKPFAPACGSLHATLPSARNQERPAVPDRVPVPRDSGNSFVTACSSDISDSAIRVHPRPRSCEHSSMKRLVDVDFKGGSDVEQANTAQIRPEDDADGIRGGAVCATKNEGERSSSFLRRYLGRRCSRSRKCGPQKEE